MMEKVVVNLVTKVEILREQLEKGDFFSFIVTGDWFMR
jgi:hypothetical protein